MTKTTERYDERFNIPADATASDVMTLFTDAISAIHDTDADIDWANLEVSSERYTVNDSTLGGDHRIAEWTEVRVTARGRK